MGIYGEWADKYFAAGFSPIPVFGKATYVPNWTEWSKEQMPEETLEDLIKKNDQAASGIGVVMGKSSGIVALDIDSYDSEKVSLFLKKIGAHSVGKIGAKGATIFYSYNGEDRIELSGSSYDHSGKTCHHGIDILGNTGQTVMPPSIHPDTNLPYKWIDEKQTLFDEDIRTSLPKMDFALIEKCFYEVFGKQNDASFSENIYGSGEAPGRNNFLKKAAYSLFKRGLSPKSCVEHLLALDIEKHKEPLFSDKEEFPKLYKSPEKAALKFAKSNYSTFKKRIESDTKKEDSPNVETEDKKTRPLCFYKEVVSTKSDGSLSYYYKPMYEAMAEYVFNSGNACFDDSSSMFFDGKMWNHLTSTALDSYIMRMNRGFIQPSHTEGFAKMIRGRCLISELNFLPTDGLLNVSNGILNTKTRELMPHSNKYFFKYVLPIAYDPDAECNLWENTLMSTFSGSLEHIDAVFRMFGYILQGGSPYLHLAFCLYGGGRNGKSVILQTLMHILGEASFSTVSMANIGKPFSAVLLDGKVANIVEETPTSEIDSESFKNLVSGGYVQAARKHYDEYSFKNNARMVFGCNDMPVFRDKNASLEDRLFLIPFDRYIPDGERDTQLFNKLIPEMSGILNWALMAVRVMDAERSMPKYSFLSKVKEEYRETTDPLYAWFMETIVVSPVATDMISVSSLHARYANDMDANRTKAVGKIKFSKRLRKLVSDAAARAGHPVDTNDRDSAGNMRVVRNIRLIDDNRATDSNLTNIIDRSSANNWYRKQ
jgi:P4 family phage/plasmid primase-like protien